MGRDKKPTKAKATAKLSKKAEEEAKKLALRGETVKRSAVLESATVTGVRTSRPDSRDLKVEQFSIINFGRHLVKDTLLELNYGRRYGLIGQNGSGKSTMLAGIAAREIDIPEHIDIWFLDREAEPSENSAIKSVVDVVAAEYQRLEELTMKLMEEDPEKNSDLIGDIGEKLDKMEPETFEPRACELLHGLGFTEAMMKKATKDMSGGWRMRVALAQALFVQPTLLVLDEPTNHLDLGACVWLEEYLKNWPSTLLLTSHSEDFLNGVCTNIMQLTVNGELVTWAGNYDMYVKTRAEHEKNQLTKYKKEQDDIQHLQEFIRSCGTFSNLRKQADSKQKIIDKMVEAGLATKPVADPSYEYLFPESEKISPPVLAFHDVSFSYSGKKEDYLYKNLEFGVDLDSRVALVGPNGAGKSTLLKLMRDELAPCEGTINRNGKLRIGQYNQHSEEVLDLEKDPLTFLKEKYVEGIATTSGVRKLEEPEWRAKLGCFGVTGEYQTRPMKTMSGGLRTRVVMLLIALTNPHILLLDEPTNHLDMQCIDSLANAINKFSGGLVLVSHDFRLIGQVAKEIWVCDKAVLKWEGDIQSYKRHLKKQVMRKFKA
jgi:ATP-binding cassette subfamily F protein 2|eukprot:TRINITY_DN75270_c0_g1_i1.p1 TRINITY_DN75270_c0_g1~~TRINITY_DN75270_c0_g1_i1.p1  ORF type:complete len:600 (-),score=104.00 TRINITY_DN75270_c0_g1_i1:500-2299(-)